MWIEFSLIMICCYFFAFISQFLPHAKGGSPWIAQLRLLEEISKLLPILFVVGVADGSFARIGIKAPIWSKDLPLTGLLILFMYLVWRMPHWVLPKETYIALTRSGIPTPTAREIYANSSFIAITVATLASCIFQEVLMRGYLLGRLKELINKPWVSILIGTVLFGAWHLYQSQLGWIETTTVGFVYSVVYLRTERIWPFIAAHFLNNLFFAWRTYELYAQYSRHF